jgi:ribokinase
MAPLVRVIGSLNADMVSVTSRFPEPGETITTTSFKTNAGGKGANQAVACGRLSRPNPLPSLATKTTLPPISPVIVEMVGAVGGLDGHFQALLRPTLEGSGLDTSRIRTIKDTHTGVAVIVVDSSAGGENRILFSPWANYSGMQPTPDVLGMGLAAPIPDVIVMQGEIPINTVIGILKEVRVFREKGRAERRNGIEAGPEVVFNPAPAPPGGLPEEVYLAIDHLIMNETEAELMTPQMIHIEGKGHKEKIAEHFHRLGVTSVVITLGARGVWYSTATSPGTTYNNQIPAASVSKVIDTTAAGDTFVGAYAVSIARWREGRRASGKAGLDLEAEERIERYEISMDATMKLATRASARCVEREGAMDSIPWEDEI